MKEQKITIEIRPDGTLSADAEGFVGDVCVKDLAKLLEGLATQPTHIARKAPDKNALTTTVTTTTAKVETIK